MENEPESAEEAPAPSTQADITAVEDTIETAKSTIDISTDFQNLLGSILP